MNRETQNTLRCYIDKPLSSDRLVWRAGSAGDEPDTPTDLWLDCDVLKECVRPDDKDVNALGESIHSGRMNAVREIATCVERIYSIRCISTDAAGDAFQRGDVHEARVKLQSSNNTIRLLVVAGILIGLLQLAILLAR